MKNSGENMNLQNNINENKKETRSIRMIRLFYVAMEKFRRYSTNEMCVGHTYGISSPFILPEGMTIEDANKVISYLSEIFFITLGNIYSLQYFFTKNIKYTP